MEVNLRPKCLLISEDPRFVEKAKRTHVADATTRVTLSIQVQLQEPGRS